MKLSAYTIAVLPWSWDLQSLRRCVYTLYTHIQRYQIADEKNGESGDLLYLPARQLVSTPK